VLCFRHIWGGPDHLLFVAGLMLLARRPRRIVWAITGFTVAHSITLSVAALGLFRLPVAPVEAMIALSILFLAAEIARGDAASFSHRYPIALSFVFGLLHGFGFASALGEIGLPRTELTTGLLFFNVGVEIGQLAFIGAITVLVVLGTRLLPAIADGRPRSGNPAVVAAGYDRCSLAGAYCLGIPAAFWFLERSFVAFTA
jgi:hydrogenase/urease accessory protein HupE